MSDASLAFQESIKDAEELLAHFDAINKNPPPANAEVLKRSGLIMALTAWETYVKDRAGEALKIRLQPENDSPAVEFMTKKSMRNRSDFTTPQRLRHKSCLSISLVWTSPRVGPGTGWRMRR